MIDGNTSQNAKEAFAATKEYLRESLEWTKEDLANVKQDLAAANGKIVELEAEVAG